MNHNFKLSDEVTIASTVKSGNASQSSIPSLVVQTMLGSSHHNLMIKGTDHSFVDYSSPSKVSQRANKFTMGSPSKELQGRKKDAITCQFSSNKVDSQRSLMYLSSDGDRQTTVRQLNLSPSSLSSSSSSDLDDLDSKQMEPHYSQSHDIDYSSLTHTVDYLKNELQNLKLELSQSRKVHNIQQSSTIYPTEPIKCDDTTSETIDIKNDSLEHKNLESTSNVEKRKEEVNEKNQIRDTQCVPYHSSSADINPLTMNLDDMRERVKQLLKQTPKTKPTFFPKDPETLHSCKELACPEDRNGYCEPFHDDNVSVTKEPTISYTLDCKENLEIMNLDLDGDLLSVDLLNRTPRADVQIKNYAHNIFKADSDLCEEIPVFAPISELQFDHTYPECDMISPVNQEINTHMSLDYVINQHEIFETESDSIITTLVNSHPNALPPLIGTLDIHEHTLIECSRSPEIHDDDTGNQTYTVDRSKICIADELDEILEASDDDEIISNRCKQVGSFYTEPSFDLSSSTNPKSAVLGDGKQPNVLTRELIFERECSKKWQPHLFKVSDACERCVCMANESSVTDYVLLGRSKDIKCTTGGCSGHCPYFYAKDGCSNVRLCQKCFDFLHFNPFSLYRQSIKSKELPLFKRKSPYR